MSNPIKIDQAPADLPLKDVNASQEVYFSCGDPADLIRDIQETVEQIEAAGGFGVTVETNYEESYGCVSTFLLFEYKRKETKQEAVERWRRERDMNLDRLRRLQAEAARQGFKLEPK